MSKSCSRCGKTEINEGAYFCPYCGAKFLTTCPFCGKTVNKTSNFCGNCGYDLHKASIEIKKDEINDKNFHNKPNCSNKDTFLFLTAKKSWNKIIICSIVSLLIIIFTIIFTINNTSLKDAQVSELTPIEEQNELSQNYKESVSVNNTANTQNEKLEKNTESRIFLTPDKPNTPFIVISGKEIFNIETMEAKTAEMEVKIDNTNTVFFQIGIDHPNGQRINCSTDKFGENLLYDMPFDRKHYAPAEPFYEGDELDLWKDETIIQLTVPDLDNDGVRECVVTLKDEELVTISSWIFKFIGAKEKIFKCVGVISGTTNVMFFQGGTINVPVGAQGWFQEYKYKDGKVSEINQ